MHVSNIRCRKLKENQIRPAAVAMYFRENANHPIVKYTEKAVHRSIRSAPAWCPVREPALHIISIHKKEGKKIMENKTVTMAHGAGGKQTSELIDQVFKAHFVNNDLTADDAAVLVPPAGRMAVSTDGFIVSPAFFPGGNIGKLSICGTVNDLACMGAKPLYLTCAFVIEE